MTIAVWAYLDEYAEEREEILAAVDRVFSSGRLILGPSVEAFEREFADWCGTSYAVGVDNGTNAIALALRAVGVAPNDEVITVPNTAAPTVVAIHAVGARARFVDIDPNTYLMNTDALEGAVTPRTACILPVHLYGQCVDMDAVGAVAARHGLAVVEDCAQAHGAAFRGRRAGSMSDAAAFSFYPTKVLGAYGDGGAAVTSDPAVEARLRRLRYYGMEDRYFVVEPGMNARLDAVQAEILRVRLKRVDGYIARRREIAETYNKALADVPLTLPAPAPDSTHVHYLYVVRNPARDALLDMLAPRGLALNVSYRWPVHVMEGFQYLGYVEGDFPQSEAAAREIFSLPMHPSLSAKDQAQACRLLTEAVYSIVGEQGG